MTRALRMAAAALALGLHLGLAQAVTPDEVLDDPALEARARAISAELRCMICQNQSIDESDAELAKDLRVLVRERLVAGDSDEDVMRFVVSRYGEFVLLKPLFNWRNAALWMTPAVLLLAGGTYILLNARRRRVTVETAPLTDAEKRALAARLGEDGHA